MPKNVAATQSSDQIIQQYFCNSKNLFISAAVATIFGIGAILALYFGAQSLIDPYSITIITAATAAGALFSLATLYLLGTQTNNNGTAKHKTDQSKGEPDPTAKSSSSSRSSTTKGESGNAGEPEKRPVDNYLRWTPCPINEALKIPNYERIWEEVRQEMGIQKDLENHTASVYYSLHPNVTFYDPSFIDTEGDRAIFKKQCKLFLQTDEFILNLSIKEVRTYSPVELRALAERLKWMEGDKKLTDDVPAISDNIDDLSLKMLWNLDKKALQNVWDDLPWEILPLLRLSQIEKAIRWATPNDLKVLLPTELKIQREMTREKLSKLSEEAILRSYHKMTIEQLRLLPSGYFSLPQFPWPEIKKDEKTLSTFLGMSLAPSEMALTLQNLTYKQIGECTHLLELEHLPLFGYNRFNDSRFPWVPFCEKEGIGALLREMAQSPAGSHNSRLGLPLKHIPWAILKDKEAEMNSLFCIEYPDGSTDENEDLQCVATHIEIEGLRLIAEKLEGLHAMYFKHLALNELFPWDVFIKKPNIGISLHKLYMFVNYRNIPLDKLDETEVKHLLTLATDQVLISTQVVLRLSIDQIIHFAQYLSAEHLTIMLGHLINERFPWGIFEGKERFLDVMINIKKTCPKTMGQIPFEKLSKEKAKVIINSPDGVQTVKELNEQNVEYLVATTKLLDPQFYMYLPLAHVNKLIAEGKIDKEEFRKRVPSDWFRPHFQRF